MGLLGLLWADDITLALPSNWNLASVLPGWLGFSSLGEKRWEFYSGSYAR